MSRTLFRKHNGQFKRPTLKDFGFKDSDISDGREKICAKCKEKSRPILIEWVCACGQLNNNQDNPGQTSED